MCNEPCISFNSDQYFQTIPNEKPLFFSKTTYIEESLDNLVTDCINKITEIGFIAFNLITEKS